MGECILCALSKLVSTIVALYDTADPLYNRREHILVGECILCLLSQLFSTIVALYDTADPRIHETPNLDWRAEFWNAESQFSQLLYQQGKRAVQKLTESRFGIPKFGIPIEIRSLMYAGIGCTWTGVPAFAH